MYPEMKDCCNIDNKDIIHILSTPSLKARSRKMQFSFSKKELKYMN